MKISAGKFKATCLSLMDRVAKTHEEIIISKWGKPVAKLVPVDSSEAGPLFGYMQNSIVKEKNITAPTGEIWNAEK